MDCSAGKAAGPDAATAARSDLSSSRMSSPTAVCGDGGCGCGMRAFRGYTREAGPEDMGRVAPDPDLDPDPLAMPELATEPGPSPRTAWGGRPAIGPG